MTTSMLTTCRCVLTLFTDTKAVLCLSHHFSVIILLLIICDFLKLFLLKSAIMPFEQFHLHPHLCVNNRIEWLFVFLGWVDVFTVQGYNSRKEYIAAQGPLPSTVNEFWRMIWEKNIQTLVMLTRCNEQGRVSTNKHSFSTPTCISTCAYNHSHAHIHAMCLPLPG